MGNLGVRNLALTFLVVLTFLFSPLKISIPVQVIAALAAAFLTCKPNRHTKAEHASTNFESAKKADFNPSPYSFLKTAHVALGA